MANEIARRLRKRMTPQEVKLWVHLRALKDQGLHFRRQVPREGYIVDFACLKSRPVVEIDGAQHGEDGHVRRDAERDLRLVTAGFKVLRFWNNEVNENLEGVIETIYHEATAPIPPFEGRLSAKLTGGVADSSGLQSCTRTRNPQT